MLLLKKIQREIYKARKPLSKDIKYVVRKEQTVNGIFAEIWFLTKGCQWDASGGCVMCNYGKGFTISHEEMIISIDNALQEAGNDIYELAITPSGSFWDEREVPRNIREHIYMRVSESNVKKFSFETRVETITEKNIKELKKHINSKLLAVEFGLETSNDWIRKNCLNKGSNLADYLIAIKTLKSYEIETLVNISLGIPFLSENESIIDTIESINWAHESGADSVIVFPIHVKPGTLVNVLYQNKLYHTISLWSLVKVLDSIQVEYLCKTQISWYKNYYTDASKIISSPGSCKYCYSHVISLLDEYRATCSKSVIDKLNEFDCRCKSHWGEKILIEPISLKERTFNSYKHLGINILTPKWWNENENRIIKELQ